MSTDTTNPKDRIGMTKPALHLVPPALKIHVAEAMNYGAFKAGPDKKGYGPYNWRDTKVRLTVYIAACMRHLDSLLDGENLASDSQVHHAAHCAAGCGIILDAMEQGTLIDDRPKPGHAAELLERFTAKKTEEAKIPDTQLAHGQKVYLAGPMRGIRNFNFPAFHEAEGILQSHGLETFNPARRDEEKYGPAVGQSETGDLADMASVTGFDLREALAADCDWIAKEATAIVVLPGWEKSKGAQAEVALGRALGLNIVPLADFKSP
jgi:hypothetical protein